MASIPDSNDKDAVVLTNTTAAADTKNASWTTRTMDFFSQYFLEGQLLATATSEQQSFWARHRKPIAILLPALIVHTVWWSVMITQDYFYLFTETSGSLDKPRYLMSITMVFGSMVAGATSEGGGAVAFPVMTLALGIAPAVARDFSFMIQSVGMVASSFTILTMRLQLEWKALLYVSLGGVVGIIFGLEQVAPRLSPPYSKMYFVVIWSSFAIGLFLLNRHHDRRVCDSIQGWQQAVVWKYNDQWAILNWKRECLFAFGVLGGIFSSMAGSGIDICSFACLTLLFRVSEKVATPTSVILMAINTTVGFAYRQFGMGGVEDDAWGFFAVCVPIVVFGAPLGAFLGSYAHRLTLAAVIYLIDAAQLIGALIVIQPWSTLKTDTPLHLSLTSLALFAGGLVFFRLLSAWGLKMLEQQQEQEKQLEIDITADDLEDPEDGGEQIKSQESSDHVTNVVEDSV